MPENIDIRTFQEAIVQGQQKITKGLESVDEKCFIKDEWKKPQGQALTGHGCTMVLKNGSVFEQAGVNVSIVSGQSMPASATAKRPEFSGCSFDALGISLVIHPRNPYIPTSHMNVRLFMVKKDHQTIDWWFGGGFDLTPYYVFEEDAQYWHQQALQACQPFGENLYPRFKKACDEYFYLPHRQETRGIGGIFFDDFNELPFVESRDFTINVLNYYLEAYLPIVKLRKDTPYGQRERQFQKYRRGRYVEFNLLYDRGTHFGIQSGGRTESILMSLPPKVHFEYNYAIEAGSAESELSNYLVARDWI